VSVTTTLDRNFFTKIGLDSGSLTMLGCVVHVFGEPGDYRCVVLLGGATQAVFYITSDPSCPVAGVNIDLAALAGAVPAGAAASACNCGAGPAGRGPTEGQRFVVHPKGYAVFHVSGGAGGYVVHARRAVEDREVLGYDTSSLVAGDIFSAVLVRPGRYSIRNTLGEGRAEVTVAYPGTGQTPYTPPAPEVVEVGAQFEPTAIAVKPMQGLNFSIRDDARIVIELLESDDGPRGSSGGTG
jgi:hypothetical protein